jgi:putative tryptophan/tyrosine transport system substrate-binding protein
VAGGEAAIRAAKRATSQIPIVMTLAADPIGSGLVPNLAHPGGNLTGMSALASDLAGKRLAVVCKGCGGCCDAQQHPHATVW